MLYALSLVTTALVPQGPGIGTSTAPVVINEFSYDDSGTDDREFVELYNRTSGTVDISNWVLDSQDPFGPNTPYTIPANTMLPAGGYYVLGSNLVPNVNQVVGATNLWENSNESLELKDASGTVVDTLMYEANKGFFNAAVAEGQGIWGNKVSIDGTETSWSRLADGYDTDNNGRDFKLLPSTPGAANMAALPPLLLENYDSLIVTTPVPNWGGSFVLPKVIDPTMVDANNPNVIPASPQGGNAAIHWDPAGGGNYSTYQGLVGPGQVFDAWVYLDGTPEAIAGDYETWSVGFGSSATFFNTPDPGAVFGFTANGNTGISWTFQVTDAGATLYLVDHNEGGWPDPAMVNNPITPPTVVTQIPIMPGVNDGWRRLRLEVVGLRLAIAQFDGGTPVIFNPFNECCAAGCFPCGNGANCPTECADPTASTAFDYLYASYREAVTDNTTVRPLTIDDIILRPSSSAIAYQGTSSASTVGTPVIAANSPPTVGNTAFAVESFNLTNSAVGFFLASFSSSTLNLQPLGGQAGAAVLNQGTFLVQPAANNSSSLSVGIPNSTAFVGTVVFWQALDLDPGLGITIPVANSQILQTTLGAL